MTDRIRIAPAVEPADVELYLHIRGTVVPEDPPTLEDVERGRSLDPESVMWLAFLDGEAVGAANAGAVYMSDEPDALWAGICVLEPARRHGVGAALFGAVSGEARRRGRSELLGIVSAARPSGRSFVLARGFRETGVVKPVALDLGQTEPPEPRPPAGVDLTTLAARPDLAEQVYEVACEAFPDIPVDGQPYTVPAYERWRERDVDGPSMPKEGFFVAVADGVVVGYANIGLKRGQPGVAYHAMTGVRREWRGRGIAVALKRATIAWAKEAGIETLETQNDELNAPMRAVNARLGYRPQPDLVLFRGPIAAA